MAALWSMGIEGETEIEKAIVFAAFKNNTAPLVAALMDLDKPLSDADRLHLAQYLRGDYRNEPGRRPKHRKNTLEAMLAMTASQLAAEDVRMSMAHRRERGRSAYGWRKRCIRLYAKRRGVIEATVQAHLDRSTKDRAHRKRPRPTI